ncbi:pyroglutamyl-peptidase I [Mitsuaria sp. WAJ17]|uniref:pyroglutamyl-peptidase I n=1 Tax=Mitsuaria sp. WAJ17 TaxID=2761452 RepID=UPI001604357E|nr:pyroglutamyl-peptidase I [Mitsuaria sp. WAJ17]MBB2487766.1 pyroglutamyl-peptidase I [Mitsuaria sp. WAJ17]
MSTPDRILITGFEPFGGESVNPSAQLVLQLQGELIAPGSRVEAVVLPCVFDVALAALEAHVDRLRPRLVLCCGQAGGRSALSLERVAINLDDARIPDNAGAQPIDRPVQVAGPTAYFTTLPVKAMTQALRGAGLPAEVSYCAGNFVCNHVFYGLMHLAQQRPWLRQAGFMHVPYLPEQAAHHPHAASMALQSMVSGLRLALLTALQTAEDLHVSEGTIC